MTPLQICLRCDRRQRPCAGRCICTIGGRDIREHAGEGDCPLEKFPATGAGDLLAKLLYWTWVGPLAKRIIRETATARQWCAADGVDASKCGCAGRRAALNRLIPAA